MTVERLLSTARKELGIKEQPADSNRVKYNTASLRPRGVRAAATLVRRLSVVVLPGSRGVRTILRRGKNGLLSHSPVLPQGAGRVRLSPWRRHFLQL